MRPNFKIFPKGQGLLEAVVAVGVIMVGIISIVSLSTSSVTNSNSSQFRLVAANLAREGLEIARAKRDDSWLEGKVKNEWMTSLEGQGGDAILVLDPAIFTWQFDFLVDGINNQFSIVYRQASTGLQRQNSMAIDEIVTNTGYSRLITFYRICRDKNLNSEISHLLSHPNSQVYSCPPLYRQVGVRVVATVAWRENGRPNQLALEDFLYNWRFSYAQ